MSLVILRVGCHLDGGVQVAVLRVRRLLASGRCGRRGAVAVVRSPWCGRRGAVAVVLGLRYAASDSVASH